MKKISVVLPIKAPTPFLRSLTEFCIRTLRFHADNPFELVVVEAGDSYFDPAVTRRSDDYPRPDKYLSFTPPIGGIKECNAAMDAANGEFIVMCGNDIIAPPHWDTYLLKVFEKRSYDCGIASLAVKESGAFIGPFPGEPSPEITEGMFSAFCMWRNKQVLPNEHNAGFYETRWRYDEIFQRIYQDSDLVLRMYEARLRAYRYNHAHCIHFGGVTNDMVDTWDHKQQIVRDEELFYRRWSSSPLWMYGVIRSGIIAYGREHEAWTRPINRHT